MRNCSQVSSLDKMQAQVLWEEASFKLLFFMGGTGSWGAMKPVFQRWDFGGGAMRVQMAKDVEVEGTAKEPEASLFEWWVSLQPVPLPSAILPWRTDFFFLILLWEEVWMIMATQFRATISKFVWKRTTWPDVSVLRPALLGTSVALLITRCIGYPSAGFPHFPLSRPLIYFSPLTIFH